MKLFFKEITYFFAILSFSAFATAQSTELDVNINTSTLSGTSAEIGVFFSAGDGILLNTVNIFNFSTDGSILPGTTQINGAVSGDFVTTLTLQNLSFFNSATDLISLGNSISFSILVTQNLDPSSTVPDLLQVLLLDPNQSSLFNTTDPTGNNALFQFQIDGSPNGNLNVYTTTSSFTTPVNWTTVEVMPVPITATFWLFAAGLISTFHRRKT